MGVVLRARSTMRRQIESSSCRTKRALMRGAVLPGVLELLMATTLDGTGSGDASGSLCSREALGPSPSDRLIRCGRGCRSRSLSGVFFHSLRRYGCGVVSIWMSGGAWQGAAGSPGSSTMAPVAFSHAWAPSKKGWRPLLICS